MEAATACPNCGSAATKPIAAKAKAGKSKAVAVLLAIPFGIFSWLYTYKLTSQRFWITLMVSSLASWLFIVGQASKDEWVQIYSVGIFVLGVLSFHIWAILGSLLKPKSYYEKYNRR